MAEHNRNGLSPDEELLAYGALGLLAAAIAVVAYGLISSMV